MSFDLSDQLQSAIDWLVRVVSGLGFFLPIAIFAIINLINGKKKDEKEAAPARPAPRHTPPQVAPEQPLPEAMPFPAGPFGWFGQEQPAPTPRLPRELPAQDIWGDPYRRDEDEALQWGSAFAGNDAEKAGSAFRWGSVFDSAQGRTKWGWDESEWGGDYAHKRDSEPKITVG